MTRWKLHAMLHEVLSRKPLWRYRVKRYRDCQFWETPDGKALWKAVMEMR